MYGQLNRPPMEEWSKQRYVVNVALIYFQKMLSVLAQPTSKLPKQELKNTKNVTSKQGFVRSADFLPYKPKLTRFLNYSFVKMCFVCPCQEYLQYVDLKTEKPICETCLCNGSEKFFCKMCFLKGVLNFGFFWRIYH